MNRDYLLVTFILIQIVRLLDGCICLPLPSLPVCPPPPPPCPAPLPCPPPPICPPSFCPPPPICPPPPPLPPPPPPCPAPLPCPPPINTCTPCAAPVSAISYQPAPIINDCCCQCGSPCRFMALARTHGAKIFAATSLEMEMEEDPQCNSEKLRNIIEENITDDPTISKRAIQKAAEEKLQGHVNVICAKSDFSYVAYTDTYCQATVDNVTCYAYKPL